MPVCVNGVTYLFAIEVQGELGVARQTLWRWRRAHKIPIGRRYRGAQILFTTAEVETIREYANRLEPAEPVPPHAGPKRSKATESRRNPSSQVRFTDEKKRKRK
jgi:hypothetical protein